MQLYVLFLWCAGERIPKKDKIESKPDKNEKRGEARKSQKQLQSVEEEKLKKTKKGPEMQSIRRVVPRNYNPKGERFLIASRFPTPPLAYIDSFNDIHSHFDDDPLSGSTTYSAKSLLEEFTDELALITYPLDYDDNLKCDIESDLREIEFFSSKVKILILKIRFDQSDLANRDDLFVDPTPEMFTDEQPPDYSFPPRFNVYPDDFLEIESDANNFDDDSFDSKGEKIKESELLTDQLDLPCDILLEIITRVAQEKKLAVSYASLLFEDFDPPFYELFVFKEVKEYKKGQNRIKTEQKREAWRSREKSEAVTLNRGRKTEEDTKRRAGNAKSFKLYLRKFKLKD
uniref:Reverse transcriptase domain-containing protein n=1 Tax=Tanacetum cinerariifolium TaxID=118510 RepID=A0A6L2LWL5_TANCI|nr:hypothetical protein [Tanacetum cinerariifolium]